jgi:ribosome-associated protein YbcJ (S4-like RNA binding protein)
MQKIAHTSEEEEDEEEERRRRRKIHVGDHILQSS